MADLGRMLRLDARRTAVFVAVPVFVLLGVGAAWRAPPGLWPGGWSRRTRGAAYTALVNAWLLDEPPPDIADTAAARSLSSWSEEKRRKWLRTHYVRYRQCSLTPYDFPNP